MIRLLIADDHEVVRFGLKMLLGGAPDITVIGMAADGRTAVTMALAGRPDVVLMDLSMPVLDGVSATREIMLADPSAKVLVHSAYSHPFVVSEAFAAGALGYVRKDSPPPDLLDAVRAVHRGEVRRGPNAQGAPGGDEDILGVVNGQARVDRGPDMQQV
jgi:DNA-binding NarL/FixJ family response regulator